MNRRNFIRLASATVSVAATLPKEALPEDQDVKNDKEVENDLKAYLLANVYHSAPSREFIRGGSMTGRREPQ